MKRYSRFRRQPDYPRGTRGFPSHDCSWFGVSSGSSSWIRSRDGNGDTLKM